MAFPTEHRRGGPSQVLNPAQGLNEYFLVNGDSWTDNGLPSVDDNGHLHKELAGLAATARNSSRPGWLSKCDFRHDCSFWCPGAQRRQYQKDMVYAKLTYRLAPGL